MSRNAGAAQLPSQRTPSRLLPALDARELAAIFAGGAVSALVWTGVVIIGGAMIFGLLAGLALSQDAAPLAGTGAVGSYTTFSTWMLETQRLVEEREVRAAAVNVIASLALGIAAATTGKAIGARL